MKITNVISYPLLYWKDEPVIPRTFYLVKIETDEGLFGFGEGSSTYGHCYPHIVADLVDSTFARVLKGEDPENIEYIVDKLRTYTWGYLGSNGIANQSISAIEIALWDIKGKAAGKPIYQLLGGHKKEIEVYACGTVKFDVEPAWHTQIFEEWKKYGLRGFKIRVGKDRDWDEELARVARECIGPDKKLMIDAYMTYTADTAIHMARRFEKYNPYFFEEPLSQYDMDSLQRITRESPIPIAMGERVMSLRGFKDLIVNHVGNLYQPDATIMGGISEAMKILSLSEAFDIPCTPHIGGLTAVGISANLQVALAHRNAKLLEIDAWAYQPLRDELLKDPIFNMQDMKDGMMKATEKPGLGIEIDESVLEKYPYIKGTPMYPEDFFHNYGAGTL